jgi:hypothetical protein
MNMLPIGIKRLFLLDISLAMGILKYWMGHMPARRQPILFLMFFGSIAASFINCYFMAWRLVSRTGGPPPWLIRPLFVYFNAGVDDREPEFIVASRNYKVMIKNKKWGWIKWLMKWKTKNI